MDPFILNRDAILQHKRLTFVGEEFVPIEKHLDSIENYINVCFVDEGIEVIQHGRVVALRSTDRNRLSSAFKAALYLGKYDDMDNKKRFLTKMMASSHSYEPIRGESILFLYIGVGKPVYDHLITHSVGRYTRIAGGQRANLPWGYEVPTEARNKQYFVDLNLPRIEEVIQTTKGLNEDTEREQIQAMRSSLPVGYIMPPYLLEFSEESLVHLFEKRIFEKGAQGATVDIVDDMWRCCISIDSEKWQYVYDYHGPHVKGWSQAMRKLRDKDYSVGELMDIGMEAGVLDIQVDGEYSLNDIKLYDLIMNTVGKPPKSMWEKTV
ncbi:hypothetical protein ACK8P5_26465 (plasmid) [Paenibacillus sp. EC2-1]|uniref:hypothetical protein n=1 Tax=Paenibacillus sp. EC2-1 TaxID=3388665 RepID=UPI003BEF1214